MLKNESAQNLKKPTPLCLARLPDSGGIIFMSNGVRMEKISHSVRQAKQVKFWMLTVPVRTIRTGHVSVHTRHVSVHTGDTWHIRACNTWRDHTGDTWQPQTVTRVKLIWHFWCAVGPLLK
jgi:hypothetical protein